MSTSLTLYALRMSFYTAQLYSRLSDRQRVAVKAFIREERDAEGQAPSNERLAVVCRVRAGRWSCVSTIKRLFAQAHGGRQVMIVYGTRPIMLQILVVLGSPANVRMFFGSDSNTIELRYLSVLRRYLMVASHSFLAARCEAALCLGRTNRAAHAALGFRQHIEIPIYSTDFLEPQRTRPIHNRRIKVVTVARLVKQKNLLFAIQALATARAMSPGVEWQIIGDGPLRDELRNAVRATDWITFEFRGAVDNKECLELVSKADIMVHPAVHEAWGIVVVEALGSGVPVLASNRVGAAQSLAAEGFCVELFDPENQEEFRKAFRGAIERLDELRELARKRAHEVCAKYDTESVVAQLERLVEERHENAI